MNQYFRKCTSEYSSVNTARSVLPSILPAVNGFDFGEQPLIKRLLQGMFKERPNCPRYTFAFGVKYVLDQIKKCCISNKTSLELICWQVGKMLATMTCLLTRQRTQIVAS